MAVFAQGTKLKRGDGAIPEVFTTIPACQGITYEAPSPEEVDTTSHSSTGGFRESISGLKGKGKVSTKIFYDPGVSIHALLRGQHGTAGNFQIEFKGTPTETVTFRANVATSFDNPVDKAREMSLDLAITGEPAWS